MTGIRDIVEPRVKVSGQGQVFPGTLSAVEPVGEGSDSSSLRHGRRGHRGFRRIARAGLAVQRSAILDMWGSAQTSRFSKLAGLVLVMKLKPGFRLGFAHCAIQLAEIKLRSRRLAVTIGLEPVTLRVFSTKRRGAGLPRIALIQGCLTIVSTHTVLSLLRHDRRESLATFIHPNELIDGALCVVATRAVGYFPITWDWQNHPLSLGLYREHGKRLNFVGVILETIQFDTFHGKEVIAHNTSLARETTRRRRRHCGLDRLGQCFCRRDVDYYACEKQGIRTTW